MAAEAFGFELQRQAMLIGQHARVEVGGKFVRLVLGGTLEQVIDLLLAEYDRQHAVLEAVVVEDVGEAGGDDDAEAPVFECPGGVLAAGAATEVDAGQEHTRAFPVGAIQLEVINQGAVFTPGPIPEEELAEAG